MIQDYLIFLNCVFGKFGKRLTISELKKNLFASVQSVNFAFKYLEKKSMLKKIAGTIWRKMPTTLRRTIVRLTQPTFTVSVVVVVTNKTGEVLLLDHVLRPASGWDVPGGFLEYGEQPAETVERELFEETGLALENIEMIRARTIGRHIEILFRARADGIAEVKSREINALGWFKINELPQQMSRIQKSVIEDLLKNSL